MKSRNVCKLVAILLFFGMLIGLVPQDVFLVRAESLELVEEQIQPLRAEDVPECLPFEDVQRAGHKKRADKKDRNNLNEIEFQNDDGTNTVYVFNENVRYVDENGDFKDKKNQLKRGNDGSYTNPHNDIQVKYPAKIAHGVTITKENIVLKIVPTYINDAVASQTVGDGKKLRYDKVFGENTILQYTQTYNGFKEDIILTDVPDDNQFTFAITTNGATLKPQGDEIHIYSGENAVGNFAPIYICDSAGNECLGTMGLAEIKPGRAYTLVVTAPWDFLLDENTVYPVSVDPTVRVYDSGDLPAIEDANVYSNFSSNFGSTTSMIVGNYNLYPGGFSRGIGFGLVKFPMLTDNPTFTKRYNAGRVTGITYHFAVTVCTQSGVLQARRIGCTWEESSVTYSSVSSNIFGTGTTYTNTISVTSGTPQYYTLNILQMMSESSLSDMAEKGVVLSAVTPINCPGIYVGTAEAGDFSGAQPYISYEYASMPTEAITGIRNSTAYMLVNTSSGNALNGSAITSQITAQTPYKTSLFTLEYLTPSIDVPNGGYRIKQYDGNLYLTGGISGGLSLSAVNYQPTQIWYFVSTGNGSYRIHNAYNENMTVCTLGSSSTVYYSNSTSGSEWRLVPCILNVPLYEQQKTYTCGMASVRMILGYFGVFVDEIEIETYCNGENGTHKLSKAIDHYLPSQMPNYTPINASGGYASFVNTFTENINAGCPVIVNAIINNMNGGYFNYTSSSGHYLVGAGYYYDPTGVLILVINDPHYNANGIIHCRTVHIPASAFYEYRNPSNQYVIGKSMT